MSEIKQMRKQIDEVDEKIINALCERVKICRVIGAAKRKKGLAVKDTSRENEVYSRIKEKAVRCGLDSGQVEAVYREIVNMCSAVQE